MSKYLVLPPYSRSKIVVTVSLFFIMPLFADINIDSLNHVLDAAAPEEKLELLYAVSEDTTISDTHKLGYALHAIDIANSLEIPEKQAASCLNLGIVYYHLRNHIKADFNLETSYHMYEELADSTQMAYCAYYLGLCNEEYALYPKAIYWYSISATLYKNLNKQMELANAVNAVGVIHEFLGSYEKAMENYLAAYRIYGALNDEQGVSSTANNLGNISGSMGRYKTALEYYNECLDIDLNAGDSAGCSIAYTNIGILYSEMGQYKKALDYLNKSLSIERHNDHQTGIALCLNNIGCIYDELGRYDLAKKNLLESVDIAERIDDKSNKATIYNSLASLYTKTGEYTQAETYLEKSTTLANAIGEKSLISNNYFLASGLYSAKSQYKKALEQFKLHKEMEDSLFRDEGARQMARMQAEYDIEKKEKENQILRQNNAIQKLELSKQITFRNSITLIFLLVLIVLLYSYRQSRYKTQANHQLNEKNAEIEKRNQELQDAMAQIKQLKGFLPICSSCKKIRDDDGFWSEVEVYIRDHTDANFSHGICPDCFKKLYPDYVKDKPQ